MSPHGQGAGAGAALCPQGYIHKEHPQMGESKTPTTESSLSSLSLPSHGVSKGQFFQILLSSLRKMIGLSDTGTSGHFLAFPSLGG